MKSTPPPLEWIISKIQNEPSPLVAFDIDSTLFCVSSRSQAILRSLALDAEFANQYGQAARVLGTIEVRPSDWGIREALSRTRIAAQPELIEKIRRFWRTHFFSNSYLHHDVIYAGAAAYVRAVEATGARVIYLTGRSGPNMREGTLEQLKLHGFPLSSSANLIMKPTEKGSDETFKAVQLESLEPQYSFCALIENEPVILTEIEARLPLVKFVHMRSTHSGRGQASKYWKWIDPSAFQEWSSRFES